MEPAILLIGTTKGLFVLDNRAQGRVQGPLCGGMGINHAIAKGDRIWAAGGGGWHPPGVWRRIAGEWHLSGDGFEPGVQSVWSLAHDGDRLLAGTKPAALYESRDEGESWQKLPGLTALPGAEAWQPGAAGLTLHTILSDGQGGLWVGISAAGVFHSADGGETWAARNRRSNRPGPAGALERHWQGEEIRREDEIFHCVHNMMFGAAPGLIYMQNHQGVYRSRDGAMTWEEVTAGLPSTFGFPIAAHPQDPGTVWTFPLNGDSDGRFPPGASAAVWRSRDGGESWQDMREGLPATDCFFTVLRQGMAVGPQAEVYFGTNSGSVFASTDEGDTWAEIARHLPTVLCVEVAAP